MRHPTEGALRRLVDEPAGVSDTDREHVANCPVCLAGLAEAQRDAAAVAAALSSSPAHPATAEPTIAGPATAGPAIAEPVTAEAAWQRLSQALNDHERPAPVTPISRAPRWRSTLRRPVVAAVGVAAILGGAGAAAAVDWLQIFKTEQVAPFTLSEADLLELPDLTAYGEVDFPDEPNLRVVADAAAAAEATELPVPSPADLPRGIVGEPEYRVGDPVSMEFTFDAAAAAEVAAEAGEPLPPVPAGLDGSRFRLVAGPGVVAVWSEARGVPALVVGRAVAPRAESSGVPFETARDYLLSLPGVDQDLAAQLRAFTADGTTLPLPLPAEHVKTTEAEVNGRPATVLETKDRALAGVVWVDDGLMNAVVGSISVDEALGVARGLK